MLDAHRIEMSGESMRKNNGLSRKTYMKINPILTNLAMRSLNTDLSQEMKLKMGGQFGAEYRGLFGRNLQ
jgi:hypothetical protein